MADTAGIAIEMDAEELALDRQIKALERKAKLRKRLRELKEAEAAEEEDLSESHMSNPIADDTEHHVLGSNPQQLIQIVEPEPSTPKSSNAFDPDRPFALRPAPSPRAGKGSSSTNASPNANAGNSPSASVPRPLVVYKAKSGSPDFLTVRMFGLLGYAETPIDKGSGARRPTTHAVGVSIQAELEPTFYFVDDQWQTTVSNDMQCTCSYSLTAIKRDAGPLLFQPQHTEHAYQVFNLAMTVSAVFAGIDSKRVALGQRQVGVRDGEGRVVVKDLEDPVVLAPKPHPSSQNRQSLWWTSPQDEENDGRIKGNRTSAGQLPPWKRQSLREHTFSGLRFKKKDRGKGKKGDGAGTTLDAMSMPSIPSLATPMIPPLVPRQSSSSSSSAPLSPPLASPRLPQTPSASAALAAAPKSPASAAFPALIPRATTPTRETAKKPADLNYIHLRVELLADLGNGEWIRVALRKSGQLIVRSGGPISPDKWSTK